MNKVTSVSQNRPLLIRKVAALRDALGAARRAGKRIGLAPTMGALHEGHLSLVRASRRECDLTVVSIYVNPTQFAPHEDLARYPRTLDADLDLLTDGGAEVVFAPDDEEMYPAGNATWVEVGAVAEPWEGQCRPGHFRGVATVVLKLFNIVAPDAAYFGQKDYQQTAVVRRMVADLNVPVDIRICPIVREPDGLAMSSRNRYLAPVARQQALCLWRSLGRADELVQQGERRAATIAAAMREVLAAAGATIEYVALADPQTLAPVERLSGRTLAALAVRIDGVRLIDNCLLEMKEE